MRFIANSKVLLREKLYCVLMEERKTSWGGEKRG